jgi:hypothetical protein
VIHAPSATHHHGRPRCGPLSASPSTDSNGCRRADPHRSRPPRRVSARAALPPPAESLSGRRDAARSCCT